MKKVELPSGKELKITVGSFIESKELYQAVLSEMKALKISDVDDIDVNLFKSVFCTMLSSKIIEEKLEVCMGRCIYDDSKITKDSFEPEEARGDYIVLCYEVALANIHPFANGLYAKFSPIMEMMKGMKKAQV